MNRTGFRRRLAAVLVAVTAAVLTAAGTLTPALAATGPSMVIDGNGVTIAVQGPDNSLLFYWQANGASSWNVETVAGPGTTFSAPSMNVDGNDTNIAVEGPDDSLLFYWNVNGSSTWNVETVAGAGTTISAPSMVVNGDTVNIAAAGAGDTLLFYWTFNGSGTWHTETVSGTSGPSTGVPSLAVDGNTFYIADVPLSITGVSYLVVWYDTIGTGTWNPVVVAQGLGGDPPAITADGSNINISAISQNGGIEFYWGSLGTWHAETVAGPTTTNPSTSSPSIAVNGNTVTIAATGEEGQLLFYYAVIGTGTWNPETVAGVTTTSSAPSIVSDAPADTADITAVSPGGQLDFYWQIDGTSGWNPETLPGSGIE
jgi:hypothetical protein